MIRLLVLTLLGGLTSLYSASSSEAETLLQVEGHMMRWAPENPGATTVITYSILTEPYNVQSGRSILSPSNCAKMHAFAGILTASRGISEANAKAELRAALNAWEQAANIVFAEVSDPHLANIVIGAADDPGGRAFANLSYRSNRGITPVTMALGKPGSMPAPAGGASGDGSIVPIDQAYVCLNPKSRWKIGFDGNLDVYDLKHTFTHEVGHAIGLDHPGSTGAVMAFRYDESVHELQPADIEGVQRLYGTRYSKN